MAEASYTDLLLSRYCWRRLAAKETPSRVQGSAVRLLQGCDVHFCNFYWTRPISGPGVGVAVPGVPGARLRLENAIILFL
jgi:hypothetical protein